MPIHNNDVAEVFTKIADLLELRGDNPFRIRAYRNAARIMNSLSRNISDMVQQNNDLTELPGIGKDLAEKIHEIVQTGTLRFLEKLEKSLPPGLSRLMDISGLGAKRVKTIYERLHIKNIDELAEAARNKKIRELEGFGAKTEDNILRGIGQVSDVGKRIQLPLAEQYAAPLIAYLKKETGLASIEIAGSYRRRVETIGDLDILVAGGDGKDIAEKFVNYEDVRTVVSKGKTRAGVILRSGIQVDLRVVPQKSYGAALHYFTGSKAHNIAIRKLGVHEKLKINEYGIYRGPNYVGGRTEADVYRKVHLPYIEPELREDRGEIEAAEQGTLPKLITLKDIRGDLHTHTKITDGRNTLEEMVQAARDKGYHYFADTEHSRRIAVARGLDAKQLAAHMKKIDLLNKGLRDFVVLKGIELDIMEDGSLDLPDSILQDLDIVVASVHYKFNLSEEKQTKRILKAMDNPNVDILGHPTGRLINKRNPYQVNMERIVKSAKARGCILELNSHPDRLDLNDIYCKMAKDTGVKISISSDAHSINDLDLMRYGIGQARRGWLEAPDVVNTRNLDELRKLLRK